MQRTATANTEATPGDDARLHATLCHVVPFYALVPLLKKDCPYVLYHAKQVLGLCAAALACSALQTVIGFVLPAAVLVLAAWGTALLSMGLWVSGVHKAWTGKQEPMPLIGQYAERMLAGIRAD